MTAHPITPLDQPARELDDQALAEWYAPPQPDRPWLRANFVSSLDGAVEVGGRSGPLSNPADQRLLGLLRRRCDVLLVGAGTLRTEGYGPMVLDEPARAWRLAHGLPEHPRLAVVSGSLNLDPGRPAFVEAPVRPLLFTTARAPAGRRTALAASCEVVTAGEEMVDPARLVSHLTGAGLPQVLCEGGARLFGHLTAAGLVDELCLTLSPQLAGAGAGRITAGPSSTPQPMTLRHVLTAGDTVFLRYLRETCG